MSAARIMRAVDVLGGLKVAAELSLVAVNGLLGRRRARSLLAR
jgi:hypothetical protein